MLCARPATILLQKGPHSRWTSSRLDTYSLTSSDKHTVHDYSTISSPVLLDLIVFTKLSHPTTSFAIHWHILRHVPHSEHLKNPRPTINMATHSTSVATSLSIDCNITKLASPETSLNTEAPTEPISFFKIHESLPMSSNSLAQKQAPAPEVCAGTQDNKRPRLEGSKGLARPFQRMPPAAGGPSSTSPNTSTSGFERPPKDGFKFTFKGKNAFNTLVAAEIQANTIQSVSAATDDAFPEPFRFLDLSSEIRNIIYKEVLTHDKAINRTAHPAFLRTNKQIHSEAAGLLYSESVATIKICCDLIRGVSVQGDVVNDHLRSARKLPDVPGPKSVLATSDPIKKYTGLWPAYITKLPRLDLELTFNDADNQYVAGDWLWYLSDQSTMNRALYSLTSHLMAGTVAHRISKNTRIAGRAPKISISITSTQISDPSFSKAFSSLLYPLAKTPTLYTLDFTNPHDTASAELLNHITTLHHTSGTTNLTRSITFNFLTFWTTSLRPLACLSLNLTPHYAKFSLSAVSMTRYASTLHAAGPNSPINAANLINLLRFGVELFSTIRYAIEKQACVFDERGDVRCLGLCRILGEVVVGLRGFDDHLAKRKGGRKSGETPGQVLRRVGRMYEALISNKSPL